MRIALGHRDLDRMGRLLLWNRRKVEKTPDDKQQDDDEQD